MFLEHFSESKHQQQRGVPETNSEKPSLAEPISMAAFYDWPTRTAKVARAHIVSFTETSEQRLSMIRSRSHRLGDRKAQGIITAVCPKRNPGMGDRDWETRR